MSLTFTQNDFDSNDGMLTDIWGPPFWHILHILSFNYPVNPTEKQKKDYYNYFKSIGNILPCIYCRNNYKNNLKSTKFSMDVFKNRSSLSFWVYSLHNHINMMLNKQCNLTFIEIQERYENYRARCSLKNEDIDNKTKKGQNEKCIKTVKKEKGCIDPLYGIKTKCIIEIVPKKSKKKSFKIDDRCLVRRLNANI